MTDWFYGALYRGVTSDLLAQTVQHRDGTFDGFTKRYNIKRLVWFEAVPSMETAIAHEKRVKRWLRDWKIALIERDNPKWDDLGIGFGLPPLR